MTDSRTSRFFRDSFLKEILDEEIMAISSLALAEKKYEVSGEISYLHLGHTV